MNESMPKLLLPNKDESIEKVSSSSLIMDIVVVVVVVISVSDTSMLSSFSFLPSERSSSTTTGCVRVKEQQSILSFALCWSILESSTINGDGAALTVSFSSLRIGSKKREYCLTTWDSSQQPHVQSSPVSPHVKSSDNKSRSDVGTILFVLLADSVLSSPSLGIKGNNRKEEYRAVIWSSS